MTASADYNVSIVESFEPPANWIPGQEINKDVYAVNTGNIPAFVKEEVSGVLTITKEVAIKETDADFSLMNCVELSQTVIPPDGNTPDFPGSPDAPGGSPGNPGGGLTGFFPPLTGYLAKDGKVWLIGMGIVVVMIVCMLILMHREKQKRNRK